MIIYGLRPAVVDSKGNQYLVFGIKGTKPVFQKSISPIKKIMDLIKK